MPEEKNVPMINLRNRLNFLVQILRGNSVKRFSRGGKKAFIGRRF
jgi:hypothetical protein